MTDDQDMTFLRLALEDLERRVAVLEAREDALDETAPTPEPLVPEWVEALG